MKKTYIQPRENVIQMNTNNSILAGSENIKISNDPVDHFDANKKKGSRPIWE